MVGSITICNRPFIFEGLKTLDPLYNTMGTASYSTAIIEETGQSFGEIKQLSGVVSKYKDGMRAFSSGTSPSPTAYP